MKKLIGLSMALCMVMAVSTPVWAQWDWVGGKYLDMKFSGEYRVEGVLNSNENLHDDDAISQYRKMRLRIQTDFNITENLRLTTRFDALNKEWHSKDSAFDNQNDSENIDFNRAYISMRTPVGLFQIGRQQGITWGTSWADDHANTDRIRWVLPIPNSGFILAAVAEKVNEFDRGTDISDGDNDKWYLGVIYRGSNYDTGLLGALYNFKLFMDPQQRFAYQHILNVGEYRAEAAVLESSLNSFKTMEMFKPDIAPTRAEYEQRLAAANAKVMAESMALIGGYPADAIGTTCSAKVYLLAPYFRGTFGNFSIETELDYVFGTVEYDWVGKADQDVESYSFFVEGKYTIGPATVQLGFAQVRGDNDFDDDKIRSMGYVAPGVDWGKMFILSTGNSDSGYNHGMQTTLGNGIGNHVGDGFATASTAMIDGYRMIYGGVNIGLMDNKFGIELLAAYSLADSTPRKAGSNDQISNKQGMEYNAKLTWNLMQNLSYEAIAAYLDAGDYWKERGGIPDDKFENTYALFHRLKLTF